MAEADPGALHRGNHSESCRLRTLTVEARRVKVAGREMVLRRMRPVWLCGPDCGAGVGQLEFFSR